MPPTVTSCMLISIVVADAGLLAAQQRHQHARQALQSGRARRPREKSPGIAGLPSSTKRSCLSSPLSASSARSVRGRPRHSLSCPNALIEQ